jgi:hypothetical protein
MTLTGGYRSAEQELILWDGALYRRVDDEGEWLKAERDRRHVRESEHVATEDLLHEGRVIKKGEVIPPPSVMPGYPIGINVYFPAPVDDHTHLVESGQARRVTNVDKLLKGRGHREPGS